MIALEKKTGINLKKGTSIRLEKDGIRLNKICIGLNWGAITKTGFLRNLTGLNTESVDLDGAVTLFSGDRVSETIYFKRLFSRNGSVIHSGDDLTGDLNGDDGLDNEVITIDLSKVEEDVDSIYIYLNSYEGHDFGDIPYSKLRIFEGTPNYVKDVLATFNLSMEEKFKGYTSMIMGKLEQSGSQWNFTAIGEPIYPKSVEAIVGYLQNRYVNS